MTYENIQTGAKLVVDYPLADLTLTNEEHTNSILFNFGQENTVVIDDVSYTFPAFSVLPLMTSQHFFCEQAHHLVLWQFNREFYCIMEHDAEIGCAGFLFYGIKSPLFVILQEQQVNNLQQLMEICERDMHVKDQMQIEMLRTLLKRIIITLTRLAKVQTLNRNPGMLESRFDMLRMFSLLVETNFRTQHNVTFYAQALNKSPKTLVNVFKMQQLLPPSKLIQNRIVLEIKRHLIYSQKSVKEISFAVGFDNPSHCSRFFKRYTGKSLSSFRRQSHS